MLENDADSICSLDHLAQQPFLQERESVCATCLPRLKNNNRTTALIVCRVEPVAEVKLVVRVRFVEGVIVEVVDGDGEVVCGVEESRVCIASYSELVA